MERIGRVPRSPAVMVGLSKVTGVAGRRSSAVAADGLLHPLPLAGIAVLVLNDHVLKAAAPGVVTGKLSDFAGLLFFPLFLQALTEVAGVALNRPSLASQRVLLAAVAATAAVFTAIKLWPAAALAYEVTIGHLQWLAGLLPAMLVGAPVGPPARADVVSDWSDLLALPALLIAYRVGRGRAREVHG